MADPRLTIAVVDTLEQAHDLQRELARSAVQAFVTRQDWQGRSRPMVGYYAADQQQAALLDAALQATGIAGQVIRDQPAAEVGWAVVFAHPSLQVAHMMRNLLDHHGLEGKVLGDGLHAHGHMGQLEMFGVAVRQEREAEAGTVVEDFLQRMAHQQQRAETASVAGPVDQDDSDADILIEWPHCPQCGQPRDTMCPKCRHIGHHLPQAETPVDAEELAAIRGEPAFVELQLNAAHESPQEATRMPPHAQHEPLWLLCPICDWLFQPNFYRRCAWCSHHFDDGLEIQPPRNLEREPINLRMILLAGGLLALLLAVLLYFGSLAD